MNDLGGSDLFSQGDDDVIPDYVKRSLLAASDFRCYGCLCDNGKGYRVTEKIRLCGVRIDKSLSRRVEANLVCLCEMHLNQRRFSPIELKAYKDYVNGRLGEVVEFVLEGSCVDRLEVLNRLSMMYPSEQLKIVFTNVEDND